MSKIKSIASIFESKKENGQNRINNNIQNNRPSEERLKKHNETTATKNNTSINNVQSKENKKNNGLDSNFQFPKLKPTPKNNKEKNNVNEKKNEQKNNVNEKNNEPKKNEQKKKRTKK